MSAENSSPTLSSAMLILASKSTALSLKELSLELYSMPSELALILFYLLPVIIPSPQDIIYATELLKNSNTK